MLKYYFSCLDNVESFFFEPKGKVVNKEGEDRVIWMESKDKMFFFLINKE